MNKCVSSWCRLYVDMTTLLHISLFVFRSSLISSCIPSLLPPSSLATLTPHPHLLSLSPSSPTHLPTLPSKSQSLTNAFNAFSDSSFFRGVSSSGGGDGQDEAKAETIRNLRKSFASLFSD